MRTNLCRAAPQFRNGLWNRHGRCFILRCWQGQLRVPRSSDAEQTREFWGKDVTWGERRGTDTAVRRRSPAAWIPCRVEGCRGRTRKAARAEILPARCRRKRRLERPRVSTWPAFASPPLPVLSFCNGSYPFGVRVNSNLYCRCFFYFLYFNLFTAFESVVW